MQETVRKIKGGQKKKTLKKRVLAPGPEDLCTVCHPYLERTVDWPAL